MPSKWSLHRNYEDLLYWKFALVELTTRVHVLCLSGDRYGFGQLKTPTLSTLRFPQNIAAQRQPLTRGFLHPLFSLFLFKFRSILLAQHENIKNCSECNETTIDFCYKWLRSAFGMHMLLRHRRILPKIPEGSPTI